MKIAIFVAVVVSATAAFANLPQPILSLTLNKPTGQIFPVTIANVGAGPASGIVLTAPSPGPEIDVACKGERLQVHYRSTPLCGATVPADVTDIRAATPDELPPGNHLVDRRRACDL